MQIVFLPLTLLIKRIYKSHLQTFCKGPEWHMLCDDLRRAGATEGFVEDKI